MHCESACNGNCGVEKPEMRLTLRLYSALRVEPGLVFRINARNVISKLGAEIMARKLKIGFIASKTDVAQGALSRLSGLYGDVSQDEADVIVALGGDGFMLHTLHDTMKLDTPVYGMNCGTIGFLMNAYIEDDLPQRLAAAVEERINPLSMVAECVDGSRHSALAINDRLMPLHKAIFTEPGLVGAKYGMSLLGMCSEEVRSPLTGLLDETKELVRAAMVHAGLLN